MIDTEPAVTITVKVSKDGPTITLSEKDARSLHEKLSSLFGYNSVNVIPWQSEPLYGTGKVNPIDYEPIVTCVHKTPTQKLQKRHKK